MGGFYHTFIIEKNKMNKNYLLLHLFFIMFICIFSFFTDELSIIFVQTFLLGYWFFYFLFLIGNFREKNKKLFLIPLLSFIFSFSFYSFIMKEQYITDKELKQKIFNGDFCHVKAERKLITIKSWGVPKNYFIEKKNECIFAQSPSYSFIKVSYKYCDCTQ